MQLKLLKSFFSKTMFKGCEIDLNFCTTQKRRLITGIFLFSDKVHGAYREIETYLCDTYFPFGVMQKCAKL